MMLVAMMAQAADPAFDAAREARLAGRMDEAVTKFEALSGARPADADVWLNLGLAYSGLRRFPDAERAFRTCLSLAPDYTDCQFAYARVAYFQGDLTQARARIAPVLAKGTPDQEVQAFLRQLRRAETQNPTWRVDVAYAQSSLTQGLADWTSLLASVGGRIDPAVTLVGSVERTERFGLTDTYAEAQAYGRLGNADGYLAFGFAPKAHYRAETALRGGLESAVYAKGPWTAHLGADAAWSRYQVGAVQTLQPYAAVGYEEAMILVRSINTWDENGDFQSGWSVRGDLTAGERVHFTAGYSDAPETSSGRTVDVKATSLGVAFDVTSRTSLRLGGVWEKRDAYDRDELTVGLTQRF